MNPSLKLMFIQLFKCLVYDQWCILLVSMLDDNEGIRTIARGKDVAVHQVSDESDDDNGPPSRFSNLEILMIYLWMLMLAKTMMIK